jgi:hypothetical protein
VGGAASGPLSALAPTDIGVSDNTLRALVTGVTRTALTSLDLSGVGTVTDKGVRLLQRAVFLTKVREPAIAWVHACVGTGCSVHGSHKQSGQDKCAEADPCWDSTPARQQLLPAAPHLPTPPPPRHHYRVHVQVNCTGCANVSLVGLQRLAAGVPCSLALAGPRLVPDAAAACEVRALEAIGRDGVLHAASVVVQCWWRWQRERGTRFARGVLTAAWGASLAQPDSPRAPTLQPRATSTNPRRSHGSPRSGFTSVASLSGPRGSSLRAICLAALCVSRWYRRLRLRRWSAAAGVLGRAWRRYTRRCAAVRAGGKAGVPLGGR